jgi:hypothetical protein
LTWNINEKWVGIRCFVVWKDHKVTISGKY